MLEKRSTEAEFTDQPDCVPALADQAYAGMTFFNKISGATRAVRQFIVSEALAVPDARPFRVLDIGAGSCDIPLALSRWAKKHHIDIQITCLDHSPDCDWRDRKSRGRAKQPSMSSRRTFTRQPDQPFDCAVGSFFHISTEDEILKLTRHLQTFVRRSLLINDLALLHDHAAAGCYIVFPAKLRHDVLVSTRGFCHGADTFSVKVPAFR